MRRVRRFALGLLLILVSAAPSAATVATIATTTPLENHADQAVNAALRAALKKAVAGAAAIGLRWFRISQALVLDDAVTVQIVATDENPAPDTGEKGPDSEGRSGANAPESTESNI